MDIGLELENVLRDVVAEGKNFERFADVVRGIHRDSKNNKTDLETFLSDVVKAMKRWPETK